MSKQKKSPSNEQLDYAGGLITGASAALALICVASAALNTDLKPTTDLLFSNYGSFVAGLLAFGAALATINTMNQHARSEREELKFQQSVSMANDMQAGALEILSTAHILTMRYKQHKLKMTNDLATPAPLTIISRRAMSHLRDSNPLRSLTAIDQINTQMSPHRPNNIPHDYLLTKMALVAATSAYLSLIAMAKFTDEGRNSPQRESKIIRIIEGEEFNELHRKFALDGGIEMNEVEECVAEFDLTMPWQPKPNPPTTA